MAAKTREVLEVVSRAVEGRPPCEDRVIRLRAKVSRNVGDQALSLLLRAGYVQRERQQGIWLYRSIKPYRAADFEKPGYSATHSAAAGGVS
jgi:hypothetical protein